MRPPRSSGDRRGLHDRVRPLPDPSRLQPRAFAAVPCSGPANCRRVQRRAVRPSTCRACRAECHCQPQGMRRAKPPVTSHCRRPACVFVGPTQAEPSFAEYKDRRARFGGRAVATTAWLVYCAKRDEYRPGALSPIRVRVEGLASAPKRGKQESTSCTCSDVRPRATANGTNDDRTKRRRSQPARRSIG